MGGLDLRFLGDFSVIRDGHSVPLPPSRKTRALLAWLCLHDRPFRREQLCDLLWEIPDDPRGSLRWSLSKLRRLLDSPDRQRVLADRASVRFDASDVAIDVRELHTLAQDGLKDATADVLEAAAAHFHGTFLEDLEFSNFHTFHAWCIAEREQAARSQAKVLRALVKRLEHSPERALPHARALVGEPSSGSSADPRQDELPRIPCRRRTDRHSTEAKPARRESDAPVRINVLQEDYWELLRVLR